MSAWWDVRLACRIAAAARDRSQASRCVVAQSLVVRGRSSSHLTDTSETLGCFACRNQAKSVGRYCQLLPFLASKVENAESLIAPYSHILRCSGTAEWQREKEAGIDIAHRTGQYCNLGLLVQAGA